MLDSVHIRGFKSIADAGLRLRSLNVLIGANGAGKSNLLHAITLLQMLGQDRDQSCLRTFVAKSGGADRILHFGAKRTRSIGLEISMERGLKRLGAVLTRDDADGLILTGAMSHPPPSGIPEGQKGLNRDLDGIEEIPERLQEISGDWRIYRFHDTGPESPIRRLQEVHDDRYLRPDGSNLAPYLYLLRQEHNENYMSIRNTIRLIAPFFDDFLLEPIGRNGDEIRLEWRQVGTEDNFDASAISGGILRFIALATLLLQPPQLRPSLILLDKPEHGLHPTALSLLAALLQKSAFESQILLATQSATLLDRFEPEDVVVADRRNGETRFRRLEPGLLAEWLDEYSLGELWEKNELGGRPANENLAPAKRN